MKSIPCNKNATQSVRKLLEYLADMEGKNILTGQHTQTIPMEEREYIHKVTGRYPKVVGFELLSYSPNINYENATEACLTEIYENRGTLDTAMKLAKTTDSILTFSFHWFSPIGGSDKAFYTEHTDFDPTLVLKEGTKQREAFFHDMDVIAKELQKFAEEDIPILWRPFHETEGTWFWWGSKGGAVAKELYLLMYDYYVNVKKLDNLIWVWSTPTKEAYPGDEYIDILGWDIYLQEKEATDYATQYKKLMQETNTRRLVALTEVGYNPDIHKLMESHIPWVYYMTWSKEFAMDGVINTVEELSQMYETAVSFT